MALVSVFALQWQMVWKSETGSIQRCAVDFLEEAMKERQG